MAHFPSNPGFTGLMRMVRLEGDIHDLEVEGEVPAELDGAFFRVHPDPQFPPKFPGDQFFNGDGMVSQFRFRNGRIDFRQRYAQTDKWKAERAAGRALFGAYRNHRTDEPCVKGMARGTANTNVLVHAGKLFAMKEDSPCLIMDAETLETAGYTDFGGELPISAFTAHPKIDPETGNFCGFGYGLSGPLTRDCEYFELDADARVLQRTPFEVPHYTMLHDFCITADYAVFNISPYMSSWEQLEKVEPHFQYDPSLPFYLGVLRRDGTAPIRWFKADPGFCGCHVMNAFQDGTKIHFDLPVSTNNSLFFFPDVDGHPFDREAGRTFLTRLTVDMTTNSDELTDILQIGNMPGEFPRIDDRMAGKKYRHGWMCTYLFDKPYEGPPGPFVGVINSLTHYDLEHGEEKTWWAGPQCGIQEPAFIPRSQDAAEGDGYLVALVDNHITNYSDLCVFDALKLDEGPIARAKLPIRLRQGLHGNWTDARRFTAQEAAE